MDSSVGIVTTLSAEEPRNSVSIFSREKWF